MGREVAPEEVLGLIYAAGLRINLSNGQLLVGPKEKLTPELSDAIRKNKQGIVNLLSDFRPAPMELDELPPEVPDGLSYLIRAGDGSIRAVPAKWLDDQVQSIMGAERARKCKAK